MNRADRRRAARVAETPDRPALDLDARARRLLTVATDHQRARLRGGDPSVSPLAAELERCVDDLQGTQGGELFARVLGLAGEFIARTQDAAGGAGGAPVDLAPLGHRSPFLGGRAAAPSGVVA